MGGFERDGRNVKGKILEGKIATVNSAGKPDVAVGMTTRELARLSGFTGDVCSNCGGAHMQIAGHCAVCADCGTTTGCS